MPIDLLGGIAVKPELAIDQYDSDLDDAPDQHRWRAHWLPIDSSYTRYPHRIRLEAYPVHKLTPCGAWIAKNAYREATKQPWEDGAPGYEWRYDADDVRWVGNRSGMSFAKPTRAAALRSLCYRLMRWGSRTQNDMRHILSAIEGAEALCPDHAWCVNSARSSLKSALQMAVSELGGTVTWAKPNQ